MVSQGLIVAQSGDYRPAIRHTQNLLGMKHWRVQAQEAASIFFLLAPHHLLSQECAPQFLILQVQPQLLNGQVGQVLKLLLTVVSNMCKRYTDVNRRCHFSSQLLAQATEPLPQTVFADREVWRALQLGCYEAILQPDPLPP